LLENAIGELVGDYITNSASLTTRKGVLCLTKLHA
jgi:hypothetical protein